MSWIAIAPTLIDPEQRRLSADTPLDPYLVWGLLTDFAGTALSGKTPAQTSVPLLLELDAKHRTAFAARYPLAPVYRSALNSQGDLGRFVSLAVPAAELQDLLTGGQVLRAELGVSRLECWKDRPAPNLGALPAPGDEEKGADTAAVPVVLGVIDDGFAFMQRRLQPHMSYLWDQNLPAADNADPGYGSELGPAAFAWLRQRGGDEDAGYRDLGLGWNGSRWLRGRSHGTAMLGAALGLQPPHDDLAGRRPTIPCVAVQLPEATLADTSGGALSIGVLDGLRYVLDRAKRLGGLDAKVLVNLSLGTQAGPHDGSSLLERAMAELVELHPGLCLMLAAGNCRLDQGHAVLRVAGEQPATVRLRVPSDAVRHGFVEFWLPHMLPLDGLALTVRLPDGESITVSAGRYQSDARQRACLIFPERCALTEAGAMVLLVIAPTGAGKAHAVAAGEWQVSLRHPGAAAWECHAYIHRDDQVYGRRGPQGLRFLDAGDGVVQPEGTLSGIATGQTRGAEDWATLTVIGAYQASDGRVSVYSSMGSSRSSRDGPDLLMAADLGGSTPGRPCLGTHSNTWQRAGGTSLAAAMATARQLALLWPAARSGAGRPGPGRTALKSVASADELQAGQQWVSRASVQEGGKRVLD